MFPRKRVVIVGGGFCGLASIAGMKEAGLDPVCFEQTDKAGGTWCYRDDSIAGIGSTMPTTVLNHSKEMGAFSTFPPKKEYNNFMRRREVYQYIMEAATEKDVLKHIQYDSEVVLVKRADDYKDTGDWTVTVKDTITGQLTTDTYDAVLVCVGHVNRPKMPKYDGQDTFRGTVMHTHSLKGVGNFQDKNVVVVGLGCSATDAAVESSRVAKQVLFPLYF